MGIFLFFWKNIYNKTKAKDKYFPLNTSTCEHCQFERQSDLSQFSNTTVRSWSSSLMLIVAIAPSLNSKEVPPSTTMQASQQRERTHNLKAEKEKKTQNDQRLQLQHRLIDVVLCLRLMITTDFVAKPLCRLLEKTLFTMGSLMLQNKRLSSGLNTRDLLYSSVTDHMTQEED